MRKARYRIRNRDNLISFVYGRGYRKGYMDGLNRGLEAMREVTADFKEKFRSRLGKGEEA